MKGGDQCPSYTPSSFTSTSPLRHTLNFLSFQPLGKSYPLISRKSNIFFVNHFPFIGQASCYLFLCQQFSFRIVRQYLKSHQKVNHCKRYFIFPYLGFYCQVAYTNQELCIGYASDKQQCILKSKAQFYLKKLLNTKI